MEREKILVFANISEFLAPPTKSSIFEGYKKINKMLYSKFVIPKLKKFRNKNDVLVICSDIETQDLFSSNDLKTKLIREYETKIETDKIERSVLEILDESFFSKKLKELTPLENTSLFDLSEEGIFFYIVASLELFFTIEKAIDIERPDKIISFGGDNALNILTNMVAEKKGVEITNLKSLGLKTIKAQSRLVDRFFPSVIKFFRKRKTLNGYRVSLEREPNRNRKVLVFTGSGHHSDMIVPWVKELNPSEILVVGLYDDKLKYNQQGIEFNHLSFYTSDEISEEVNRKGKFLKKSWNDLKHDSKFKSSLKYENINLWKIMEKEFMILFFNFFLRAFEYFKVMLNAIETEDPNLIVVLNDRNMFGKSASLAGNLKGKKTLCIQHGTFGNIVRKPSISDKIAVFGKYDRDSLIKRGIEKEKIIITGQPRYDLPYRKKFDKNKTCKKLGIDPNKRIVVFTTQLEYPTQEPAIKETLEAVKDTPDVQMVFKLHPFHDRPLLPKLNNIIEKYRKYGIRTIIVEEINIYELLNICDVMITEDSTAWLDAFVLGKPVISMNLGSHRNPIPSCQKPYKKKKIVSCINREGELKGEIKKILKGNKFRKRLEEKINKNVNDFMMYDGKATERIKKLILKMAS